MPYDISNKTPFNTKTPALTSEGFSTPYILNQHNNIYL